MAQQLARQALVCAAVLLAAASAQAAAFDFDDDERSDVLWRNAVTGENCVYPLDCIAILGGELTT